jgi:hypothetical protein
MSTSLSSGTRAGMSDDPYGSQISTTGNFLSALQPALLAIQWSIVGVKPQSQRLIGDLQRNKPVEANHLVGRE